MIMWEITWIFYSNLKIFKKKWIDCTYGNIHLCWVGIFCTNWLKNNNKKADPPNWPIHSSLLSVFGLSATSTYDSYLPLIFGIFGMIWGHFWNVRKGRFRGHGGRRGQTTSKSKTTKILNQNLLKLDEIQNLASATSKMTSWPQWPRKRLSGFFQRLHF